MNKTILVHFPINLSPPIKKKQNETKKQKIFLKLIQRTPLTPSTACPVPVSKFTGELKLITVPVTFHCIFFYEYSIDNTRIKTTTP